MIMTNSQRVTHFAPGDDRGKSQVTGVVVMSTDGWPADAPHPASANDYPFTRALRLDLDDFDSAVPVLRQITEGSLVVSRHADADTMQRALQQADPSGTGIVGRVSTRLTQAGSRILADLLATAADRHGIAAAVASVEDLERLITCFLVAPSVTKLSAPAPSITQHARSWWPQSVFTVRLTGRAGIVSTGPPTLGAPRLTGVMAAPVVDSTVRTAVDAALRGRHVVDLGQLRPEAPGVGARGIEICCLDATEALAAIRPLEIRHGQDMRMVRPAPAAHRGVPVLRVAGGHRIQRPEAGSVNARQRRGLFLVVLAMVLGLIAFVMVSGFVEEVRADVGTRVTAWQVNEDVDAFTEITPSMVTKVSIPEKWVGAGVLLDDSFIGRRPLRRCRVTRTSPKRCSSRPVRAVGGRSARSRSTSMPRPASRAGSSPATTSTST